LTCCAWSAESEAEVCWQFFCSGRSDWRGRLPSFAARVKFRKAKSACHLVRKSHSLQELLTPVATGVAKVFDRKIAEVSEMQATAHTD
jgi:hypothetical protein